MSPCFIERANRYLGKARAHAAHVNSLESGKILIPTGEFLAGAEVDRGAVIGSAIIPTIIAQRWFAPPVHILTAEEIAQVEDEEFEPPPQ